MRSRECSFAGAGRKDYTNLFESWDDLDDDEEYKTSQDVFHVMVVIDFVRRMKDIRA